MNSKKTYLLLFLMILGSQSLQAQICNNAIPKTTPDNAFALHNNGTVTHNKTGLMWMRCELGQTLDGTTCGGSGQNYTWQSALQAADSYTFAGYSDWRLPNKNELASIVEQACYSPAINTLVFPNATSSDVWSSSPVADNSNNALVVNFNLGHGNSNAKTLSHPVRLVRGGQ